MQYDRSSLAASFRHPTCSYWTSSLSYHLTTINRWIVGNIKSATGIWVSDQLNNICMFYKPPFSVLGCHYPQMDCNYCKPKINAVECDVWSTWLYSIRQDISNNNKSEYSNFNWSVYPMYSNRQACTNCRPRVYATERGLCSVYTPFANYPVRIHLFCSFGVVCFYNRAIPAGT